MQFKRTNCTVCESRLRKASEGERRRKKRRKRGKRNEKEVREGVLVAAAGCPRCRSLICHLQVQGYFCSAMSAPRDLVPRLDASRTGQMIPQEIVAGGKSVQGWGGVPMSPDWSDLPRSLLDYEVWSKMAFVNI